MLWRSLSWNALWLCVQAIRFLLLGSLLSLEKLCISMRLKLLCIGLGVYNRVIHTRASTKHYVSNMIAAALLRKIHLSAEEPLQIEDTITAIA
jgi:hypothetical protein